MKTTYFLLLLITLSTFAVAKKDPVVEARKDFATQYQKLLERKGFSYVVLVTGKAKDVLQIWLPQVPVDGMHLFEEQCVEPVKSELKEAGFNTVEIKTDVLSASFPKGVWNIPLP